MTRAKASKQCDKRGNRAEEEREDIPNTSGNSVIDVNLRHDALWQIQLFGELDNKRVVEHDVDQVSQERDKSCNSTCVLFATSTCKQRPYR